MVDLQNINFKSLEMLAVILNYFNLAFTRRPMILFFFFILLFIAVKLDRRAIKVRDGRQVYVLRVVMAALMLD